MGKMKPLVIGGFTVEKPVIQGGMGVGISLHRLAGAVAKAGGVGIISTAQIGFREPDFETNPLKANLRAIGLELRKAREIAPEGVIGFNIMVATRQYGEYVKAAVKAGADLIISGAGLPVSLPEYVEEARRESGIEKRTLIAPIVSTAKSAGVICKMWDRKYGKAPDLVVIEGPLAGGHLGFSREQLGEYGADTEDVEASFKSEEYDREIGKILDVVKGYGEKYGRHIPVISAGGVFTREDMEHHMALGADGVQVGTRFVTTVECDAPPAYKQAYIQAKKEDIVIVKSPVGMPGRAIRNPFLEHVQNEPEKIKRCFRCLEHCDPKTAPYCITMALVRAALGDVDHALLFCGFNAWKCSRIETVEEVIRDLTNSF